MTIIRTVTCPDCGARKDVTSRQIAIECDVCYRAFGDSNSELKERLAEIDVRISQHNGEIMKLQEERVLVQHALIPYPARPEVLWVLSEFDLHCHHCGAVTRWKYRGGALCADSKCIGVEEKKPSVSKKRAVDPALDQLIRDMIAGKIPKPPAASPSDDDGPDDTEYIKVRP